MAATAWTAEEELGALRDAIRAYAPSFKEQPVAAILGRIFDGLQVAFSIDGFGNVKAVAGSGRPVLLLASHMDTIASMLPFSEDADFLHGRGAVDCRPSLLAMALATRRAVVKGFTGTIVFGGIAAEEVSTDGIKVFMENMVEKPDFAIFGEPTGAGKVCIAYKGRVWLALSVACKPGHVAAAWIHANAIEAVAEFYQELGAALKALAKGKELTPYFTPRAAITTIHAGSIPNMLPDGATADVDVRFPPAIKKEQVIEAAGRVGDAITKKYQALDASFSMSVEVKSSIDAIRVGKDNAACESLAACIESARGEKPSFVKKTGTTFMNHIGSFFGCPVVTYGPGDPALEHTPDEMVSKKEFLQAVDVLEALISRMA
ncbi:MAG: M20/M25/M40 family metallo-hydrolase [Candidatus Lokiarchaeota archaeon]|nr:M20/M25/M40 family metallo-hydrolase [Candidatus Lokiarchaeota archaeon]